MNVSSIQILYKKPGWIPTFVGMTVGSYYRAKPGNRNKITDITSLKNIVDDWSKSYTAISIKRKMDTSGHPEP